MVRSLVILLVAVMMGGGGRPATSEVRALVAPVASSPTLEETIAYLASDELEGRGIGTEGLDKAAQYIAGRFRRAGLRPPPGQADYFQRFDFVTADGVDPRTTFAIGDRTCVRDKDYTVAAFSAEGDFDGPVVFAGYGIVDPEHGHDDYAAVDVKDKVVLVLRYEPHGPDGRSRLAERGWSRHAALEAKVRAAHERGARAVLLVNPPLHHGADMLLPFARSFVAPDRKLPFLHVRREIAEDLLTRGGAPGLAELQRQIDEGRQAASRALAGVSVGGRVHLMRTTHRLRNVVAWLPGRVDDEYLVIGAHYDHLGRGGPASLNPRSAEIHNGADDNASGTAALLDLADRLAAGAATTPPGRSILFVAFTAEEVGLVGSGHFVRHPPVPLERIVAMINLDMVGRVRNDNLLVGGAGTAAEFDAILARADGRSPLRLKTFGRGGLGPSDHTPFALKRIPVLFLFTGVHADYHRPTDDADKINYDGLRRVVDFAQEVALAIADLPRPQYVAAADEQSGPHSAAGARVTLGVVPDYTAGESSDGVRITGTVPGSPAERAGLREGDVLVRLGDRTIENVYDLAVALAEAEPGERVRIALRRDGRTITVEAVLEGR